MPHPPAREFVQLDSTLETLRAIVAGSTDLPAASRIYVRLDRDRATRHGSELTALVIASHGDQVAR